VDAVTDDTSGGPSGGSIDCGETVERLYFFLDGELTDDRRREIKEHLDLCAPCEEVFVFEAELRRVIADRCKDHVPEYLRLRIAAAIDDERLKSKS
jgi:mycothiol system anti-sigma-R factor